MKLEEKLSKYESNENNQSKSHTFISEEKKKFHLSRKQSTWLKIRCINFYLNRIKFRLIFNKFSTAKNFSAAIFIFIGEANHLAVHVYQKMSRCKYRYIICMVCHISNFLLVSNILKYFATLILSLFYDG